MNDPVAVRVAAKYMRNVLATRWEGKLVGNDFRLQWSRDSWQLEELPQKGKKKLRVATLSNPGGMYGGRSDVNLSPYIAENILRFSQVSAADSYDHVKAKIAKGYDEAAALVIADAQKKGSERHWDFLNTFKWYENQVNYLQVMPEGMEPIDVEGQDFSVKVEWTSFKAYDPDADFQSHDPHYTLYEASSPGAARKFYQMAKENPSLIKHIPWAKFSEWLNQNKIGYKTHFSVWH